MNIENGLIYKDTNILLDKYIFTINDKIYYLEKENHGFKKVEVYWAKGKINDIKLEDESLVGIKVNYGKKTNEQTEILLICKYNFDDTESKSKIFSLTFDDNQLKYFLKQI